jgi:ABC-type transport system substrate-binding protein
MRPYIAPRNFLRATNDSERQRAASTMTEILQTYVPVIPLLVDVENAFAQPWLQGYFPSPFRLYFQYYDIAPSKSP